VGSTRSAAEAVKEAPTLGGAVLERRATMNVHDFAAASMTEQLLYR
jgi:hypothetical protein